jgi:TRAP-type C4-dicarboxylate transport system permease small subunit
MKPILTTLFLIVSLLLGWGCTHTTAKSGSDHFEISRVEFASCYKAYVYVILGG